MSTRKSLTDLQVRGVAFNLFTRLETLVPVGMIRCHCHMSH